MNLKFNILNKVRPVVKFNDIFLLFDTGASTPVWCGGFVDFKDNFPKAIKMDYRFLLTGFGRSETELVRFLKNPDSNSVGDYFTDVYKIPEFILETGERRIFWKDLNVAVTNRRFSGVHMILPYTMFGGMSLKFNQNTVNSEIVIESPKATKYTFVKLNNNFSEKVLQYIYAQEDEPEQRLTKVMDIF